MAFNAKNLSYDRNQPAFLRKLRDQYGGPNSVRHERPAMRPRKQKENDDEDAPVYVDEETNEAISKEEYESLLNNPEAKGETTDKTAGDGKESTDTATLSEKEPKEDGKPQQKSAEIDGIGSQKKRRKAKVIRDDDTPEDESRRKDNSAAPKPSTKRKKIKLSFDEPE